MVDRVRRMARPSTCAALLGVAFAAGCGGGGRPAAGLPAQSHAAATAEIRQVVDRANSTFAEGEYERTCSYYTEPMQRLMTSTIGGRDCASAQKHAADDLRGSISRATTSTRSRATGSRPSPSAGRAASRLRATAPCPSCSPACPG